MHLTLPPQVQMSMVTRHGARAPANVLPNEDVAWYCSNTDVVELSNPPIADRTYSTHFHRSR